MAQLISIESGRHVVDNAERLTSFAALDRHCRGWGRKKLQILVINCPIAQNNLGEFSSDTVRQRLLISHVSV